METQGGARVDHDGDAPACARRRSVIGDGGNADSDWRTGPVTADTGTSGNDASSAASMPDTSPSSDAEPGAVHPVIARGNRSVSAFRNVRNRALLARPGHVRSYMRTAASIPAQAPRRLGLAAGSRYRSPTSRLDADFAWTR